LSLVLEHTLRIFIKLFIVLTFLTTAAHAKVVSTLPEFSWIVKQLLPKVESLSLLEGVEDPHFVDASPSFVFKLAKAKVLILNGLELEAGWIPAVIQMSGNADIQPGSKGYCNASSQVVVIEKIKNFNRSMGDVHAQGNPHYSLSLRKMISVASGIKDCLIKVGYKATTLEANYISLKQRLELTNKEIRSKWTTEKIFYVYHREFNYLASEFPIKLKQSIESVPGVLPSANHLVKMASLSRTDKPSKVIASYTAPTKVLEKFKEISNIPFLKLRLHPARDEDYIDFIEKFHKLLLE
jgi:zinc/manganese transport system substrate-binding protein